MAGGVRGVRVAFVRSGCDFEHSPPRSYIELGSARTGAQILQAVGIVTLVWRRLGVRKICISSYLTHVRRRPEELNARKRRKAPTCDGYQKAYLQCRFAPGQAR